MNKRYYLYGTLIIILIVLSFYTQNHFFLFLNGFNACSLGYQILLLRQREDDEQEYKQMMDEINFIEKVKKQPTVLN